MASAGDEYELYYYGFLAGRAEFIRLIFEEVSHSVDRHLLGKGCVFVLLFGR